MARLVLLIALALAVFSSTFAKRKPVGIIGGTAAKRGQFPYQVAFLYKSGSLYCGGSLISDSFVLTAAHCYMSVPSNFNCIAGSLSYINYMQDGQERSVSKFYPHERFTNVASGWDIALVKVAQPFEINLFVKPIHLSSSGAYPTGSVIASGWGRTRYGDINSVPEFLQTVVLGMVSYAECESKYGSLPDNVCCASAPGKDTCQGDSGGPLVQNVYGELILVGITSYGNGCANDYHPGIYTTVTQYFEWIGQTKRKLYQLKKHI